MKKFLLTVAAALVATCSFAQTNLLENGDFESWVDETTPTSWKSTTTASNATLAQSTTAHSGKYSVMVANATSNKRLAYKELTLKPGTYTFSFYAKAEADVLASARPGYAPWDAAQEKLGSYVYGEYTNDINDWAQVSYEFTLDKTTQVNLVVMNPKSSDKATYGNLLIDDAVLTTTNGGIDNGSTPEGPGDEPGDKPSDLTIVTVAEAQAAEANAEVAVQGTVYAVCGNGFVVGDKTGYIFHYGAADVKVGDVITMSGAVSAYGGFNQFKNATIEVKSNGTVTYPEIKVMDGAAMDAWFAAPEIAYVQFEGKLAISGNYYNVTVEGAETTVGSLINPSDDIKAKISNGNTYVFQGFAMYTSGGKYINVVVTDAKAEGEVITLKDISNTMETAYTVSQAIKIIEDANNDLSKKVYVKGIICAEYKEKIVDASYGNATFFISEDGNAESEQFEIYRGYWFGGEKFTSEDQLKLGDEVIYYGNLTKYNTTYETTQGAELVWLNGDTTPVQNISVATEAGKIYDLSGRQVSKMQKGLYIINGKKVLK